MNPWLALILAGLLEVVWASSLKSTVGFTKMWPTLLFAATLAGSMFLLNVAVRRLPIGTAYAVWVGIGAAGTAIAAMVLHGEIMTLPRGLFLALLIVAIAGLKLTTPSGDRDSSVCDAERGGPSRLSAQNRK